MGPAHQSRVASLRATRLTATREQGTLSCPGAAPQCEGESGGGAARGAAENTGHRRPVYSTAAPRCGTSDRKNASARRGAAPVRAEIEVEIVPPRSRGGHGEASAWASDSDAEAEAGAEACECAECGLHREDDREEARRRVSAERRARGSK